MRKGVSLFLRTQYGMLKLIELIEVKASIISHDSERIAAKENIGL